MKRRCVQLPTLTHDHRRKAIIKWLLFRYRKDSSRVGKSPQRQSGRNVYMIIIVAPLNILGHGTIARSGLGGWLAAETTHYVASGDEGENVSYCGSLQDCSVLRIPLL